jgi:hypothetical protein
MPRPATPPASAPGPTPRVAPSIAAAPRFAALWAAAVYAVGTAWLGFPAFLGQFLVSPVSDQYIGGYAVREFGTAVLRQTGHWPLWNPYLFGGMPYIAAMAGDIFYPTFLLRLVLPADVGVTWAFMIHIFLAGWLTYLFLRVAGLGFWGALAGGLAYMMGGPIASYVSPGHDGKLYVSALFPLALLLITRGVRDGRASAWPLLALTVGLGILTPHPQLMQYMLLGAGAYAVYLAFWSGETVARDRRTALRRLGTALGSVVLGLSMGAIQFLPVAQYVPYSPRAGGGMAGRDPYDFAASYSMPPEELINTYLPQFSGLLDNYWGRTGIHFQSEYLGAAVLVLAGCAFIATPAARRRDVRFWLVVALVGTLWSIGGYTPFYRLVYTLVPGTHYFRAPAAFFFLTGFAVAVLAGIGAENVLERRVGVRYAAVWAGVAAFVGLLAASGALTTFAEGIASPEALDRVADNAAALTAGALRCLVVVVLAAAAIVLLRLERLPPRAGGIVLAIVVALDLWSVERLYWNFSPPASQIYASDAAIDSVKAQTRNAPGRVLAVALGPNVVPHDPELLYDGLMVHRVRNVLGYHGNQIRRYDVLTGRDSGYRQLFTPQLWRLLNVRYVLCDLDSFPVPGVTRVAGPTTDAAGSRVSLYRLPGDNPVAWVTPVSVKAGDTQTLATVLDSRFDPSRAAVFDTSARVAGEHVTALPAPLRLAVTTTRYDPGHMTFRLSGPAPQGAALIISENYYPGWEALVDGRPAAVGRADYTLIGVPLGAGATSVDVEFHSTAFEDGALVTLVAATAAIAWWAAATLQRRRHG